MRHRLASFCFVMLVPAVLAMPARGDSQNVIVRLVPANTTVNLGETFTIDIIADILSPIVGWGLDVEETVPDILTQIGVPDIPNPPWVAEAGMDGDGLAALADPFAPTTGAVVGDDTLLATLTLQATQIGETFLIPGTTPGDLTEGFPLIGAGFANQTFEVGTVTVVPEPTTILPLMLGVGLVWRRR